VRIFRGLVGRLKMPRERDPLLEGIADGRRAFCGPEQLHIDLTNKCNLHCIACWHRSPLLGEADIPPHWNPRHELPLGKVLSLIDEAAQMGVRKVVFSGGGDSLLYGNIFDVISRAAGKGLQILLVSNLTMATNETMRRIVDSGVTQLLVNLWAGSPGAYLAAHPGTSAKDFSHVLDMMETFVDVRRAPTTPELIISNVFCTLNYKDVENMVRLALDIGACAVWYQTVDVESNNLRKLILGREQIKELLEDLERVRTKYMPLCRDYQKGILYLDELLEKLTNSRAPEGIYHSDIIDTMPCYMGWAGCRILANGDVVPCCKADKHPLGSIRSSSLREVWNSSPYNEFRGKAVTLSKKDLYFARINCAKVCDNWGFNRIIHARCLAYFRKRRIRGRIRGGEG
jgi:MoaA/NifB/PqqE/SkfB family radical SAM enzyme